MWQKSQLRVSQEVNLGHRKLEGYYECMPLQYSYICMPQQAGLLLLTHNLFYCNVDYCRWKYFKHVCKVSLVGVVGSKTVRQLDRVSPRFRNTRGLVENDAIVTSAPPQYTIASFSHLPLEFLNLVETRSRHLTITNMALYNSCCIYGS